MNADLLAKLIAAGVSADLIAEVATTLATAQAQIAILEKRRAGERERKARSRAVTGQTVTSADERDTSSPKERSPLHPSKEITPPPSLRSEKSSARATGSRLPTDWQPSQADLDFAATTLGSDDVVRQEVAKFRDYWIAKPGAAGRKVDWPATWRNWIRNARPQGGSPRGRGPPVQGTSANGFASLLARKLADEQPPHHQHRSHGDRPQAGGPEAPTLDLGPDDFHAG